MAASATPGGAPRPRGVERHARALIAIGAFITTAALALLATVGDRAAAVLLLVGWPTMVGGIHVFGRSGRLL